MSFILRNFILFHSPYSCKFGTDIDEVKKTAFLKQSFTRLNKKQTRILDLNKHLKTPASVTVVALFVDP